MAKITKHIAKISSALISDILKIGLTFICFIILILFVIVIGFAIFDDTEEKCMEKCLADGYEATDCSNNRCDFPI